MKPTDVKSDSFAEYKEESNEKGPKFKVRIMSCHKTMSEFQNTKMLLLKDMLLIGVKRFVL